MINVGSVLNPSRRCSSNVMLGKSFEDIPDFLSSFNRLRNSFLSASNLVLEFFDVSFCNVIFVLLALFVLFSIIIICRFILKYRQVKVCELVGGFGGLLSNVLYALRKIGRAHV